MSIRLLTNFENMFEDMDPTFFNTIKTMSTMEWNRTMDLRNFPTKPEDLKIKIDGDSLVVSGKSEIKNEQNGLKINSTHDWSQEFKLDSKVNRETIKATIDKQNILRIIANYKEREEEKFEIPIHMD